MGQKENNTLPLNPDGSPDLNRVTAENIYLAEIPEDQRNELIKLHEPVGQNLNSALETKMSRRALLYSLPVGILAGALLKDGVSKSLNKIASGVTGNTSNLEEVSEKTSPVATPIPEPTRPLEVGENREIPFPYQIDGWTMVIKKADIDRYRAQLASVNKHWSSAKISITHHISDLGDEAYAEQNFSPGISLLNNEMFMSDDDRETLNIFYKDGNYSLPTAPITENTFLKIETKNIGDEGRQVDMFPIDFKTGFVFDKLRGINPQIASNYLKVLFENAPGDKISPQDIYLHALCLNALSRTRVNRVIVPADNDRAFIPSFPAMKHGMYLTVPESIASLPSTYPAKEHPALIRMTKDFTAKICKNPDPIHGAGAQAILTSLENYILENRLQIPAMGSENMEIMDTLSIGTFKYYDVRGYIFNQIESVKPTSDSAHAQNALINLVPVLLHKSKDFENAYDNLTQDQKNKADVIVIHALSLLFHNAGKKDKFDTAFSDAQKLLEKRGITDIPAPIDIARGRFGIH